MTAIKLIESEVLETRNVFNLADGPVTVVEREVHEFYGFERSQSPRLIIVDAIDKFVTRSRSEIAGLSSLMQELSSAR
ncbi:MAG: hypothetical protein ABIR33_16375 [Pyrinomonadaceae bacterium]